MITPQDIEKKAARKYHDFLRSTLTGDPFFPIEIRFRKAKATDDYLVLRDWVAELLASSKSARGYGYEVLSVERELRRYGRQSLPERIAITNEGDYLRLIGKSTEAKKWRAMAVATSRSLPALTDWLIRYPGRALPCLDIWEDLLLVCNYFLTHPRPNLYLRELPLPLHTKFIEENQAILHQLLGEILPAAAVREGEGHFERRYGLRYDEPLVRLRLLDLALVAELGWPAADISLPLSAGVKLVGMAGLPVIIVENKMTFLTLPPVSGAVAIWGQGFQAALLREWTWLAAADLYYWGDLDAQGFAILAAVRAGFPGVRSLLMDEATLATFAEYVVKGTAVAAGAPVGLTPDEAALYERLAATSERLEQEHVDQAAVGAALRAVGLV